MATVRHLGLFPFCVSPFPPNSNIEDFGTLVREVGPYTEYPFTLPIRLCTRMWWTVRHWKITFNYYELRTGAAAGGNPGDFTLINQAVELTTADDGVAGYDYVREIEDRYEDIGKPPQEKDLVCVTYGTEYEPASRASIFTVPLQREFSISGNGGISTTSSTLEFYTSWDNQQDGYSAPFSETIENKPDDKDPNFWAALSFSFRGWDSHQPQKSKVEMGKFELLGVDRDLPISHIATGAGVTETLTNLLIEPQEFWPYDPGDGLGPIYDIETGKQLRAFPA